MSENSKTALHIVRRISIIFFVNCISALMMTLLVCVINLPGAWVSAKLDLSEDAFFVLAIIPFFLVLYLIQHFRIDTRAVEKTLGYVAPRQVIDLSQMPKVRDVRRVWRDFKSLSRERSADLNELYRLVEKTNQETRACRKSARSAIRDISTLLHWSQQKHPSVTKQQVEEKRALVQRSITRAIAHHQAIARYNDQVLERVEISSGQRKLRSQYRVRWQSLKQELKKAEGALRPTLWVLGESRYRWLVLAAREFLYERIGQAVIAWLRDPLAATRVLNEFFALAQRLIEQTIHCRDGNMSFISKAVDPGQVRLPPSENTKGVEEDTHRTGAAE